MPKTIKLVIFIFIAAGIFVLGWHFGTRHERAVLSAELINRAAKGQLLFLPRPFYDIDLKTKEVE